MEGNLVPKLAFMLVAACLAGAAAQPLGCTADYQCEGYCDKEAKLCRECLKCEDFKRSPPATSSDCIKTILDCGACFEGLVENVQGDLYAQCTPRDAEGSLAYYVWIAIVVGGVLIVVVIIVILLRYTDLHVGILASTDTSVQSGCANVAAPSAPERPPAYNSLYTERPDSPPGLPHFTDEEAERPFLKPNPPSLPARESAGSQAANFYNNPNYVRGPHLPSNYHTAKLEPEPTPEYLQDETTAESPWTPDNNNAPVESSSSSSTSGSSAAAAAAPSLSEALAAERSTALVRPPRLDAPTPSKQPRLRQDTNNNRSNRDSEEESMSRSFNRPTINISVNVQQVNDVKL